MKTPTAETDRVRRNTADSVLRAIDRKTENNIALYSRQSGAVISERIEELEREWSIERWLETNASALAFTGTLLGLTVNKKWFVVPLLVTGFLFQHAVQGWCPPVPFLRKAGVRTRAEIDREKFALKVLRGDVRQAGSETGEDLDHAKRGHRH
ncbi:MAG TPA: hypothetical protein VGV18_05160 [Verrucomicrobiae bacterium]|nr:hypothetical protein [Verrucomicrobiae bacterium]